MKKENIDYVNSPPHYRKGSIECIDAIKAALTHDEYKGYLKGAALKYIWRESYKDSNIQDLQKSVWYINKLIEHYENL